MSATLVFLGRLADATGCARMVVPPGPLALILAQLPEALSGPKVRLALNGAMLTDALALVLREGDELAFLPPVSGG